MNKISTKSKLTIQSLVIITMFFSAIFLYLPIISYLDSILLLDFSDLMLILGIILGCLHCVFLFINFIFSSIKNITLRYLISILPSSYMFTSFLWYAYLIFNKHFSETDEDFLYFQTVLISFSIYFLITKIVKE